MSRSAPNETKQAMINQLQERAVQKSSPCRATWETWRPSQSAMQQIPADFPPLRGVIHAAGVLADGIMFDMELDQLRRPLASKIDGTWNLHEATKDSDLDFFRDVLVRGQRDGLAGTSQLRRRQRVPRWHGGLPSRPQGCPPSPSTGARGPIREWQPKPAVTISWKVAACGCCRPSKL